MADSYLSVSDAFLKRGSGGHKGTRELPRSYSGYAGRHSSSPQQKSPRAFTPAKGSRLSKLEQRAAGEVGAGAARAMVERLVTQRLSQHESGLATPSNVTDLASPRCCGAGRGAGADGAAVSVASDGIARAAVTEGAATAGEAEAEAEAAAPRTPLRAASQASCCSSSRDVGTGGRPGLWQAEAGDTPGGTEGAASTPVRGSRGAASPSPRGDSCSPSCSRLDGTTGSTPRGPGSGSGHGPVGKQQVEHGTPRARAARAAAAAAVAAAEVVAPLPLDLGGARSASGSRSASGARSASGSQRDLQPAEAKRPTPLAEARREAAEARAAAVEVQAAAGQAVAAGARREALLQAVLGDELRRSEASCARCADELRG